MYNVFVIFYSWCSRTCFDTFYMNNNISLFSQHYNK